MELTDHSDPALPLERVEELSEPERTTYALRVASAALKREATALKLLGRELLRRGKLDEVYTRAELDSALPARIADDGRGNYVATIAEDD